MHDTTVSHAFSISLIARKDCYFAVTSSSTDKLSSITSCCDTQCNSLSSSAVSSWLHSSTSLSISLLSTCSPLILARHNLVVYRLHWVIPETPHVTVDNTLRPKILPSKSDGCLVNSFPNIFDHFEAVNNVEVIFLIFFEIKVNP
ncbi:hypothetical protein AVEN_52977-1 [Araneus ventricosus]|uniref:Uncharacterized protein n=1 Tax=Araneus ventricosus TaxID=182803 RepID=A0A4Y2QKJ3_ARAVE|nr:hypothetical protein AVEN_52977-1 [Araneus ventricosus]